ncbi:MAG: hypothetical protein QOH70_1681 [Blastocatellia bacterium]|nr:hypothetical protein [Blastocatellia bacterium]
MAKEKSDLELRAERINYEGDLALDNLKCFYDGLSVAEGYCDGRFSFHLHVGAVGACAFEYFADSVSNQGLGAASYDCDFPVLVWVRDVAQGFRPVNSLVRLVRLDSVYVRGRAAPQITRSESLKVQDIVADRKLCSVLADARIVPRQLKDEMVERRSKVMNTIADSERDNIRQRFADGHDDVRLVPNTIMLDAETILMRGGIGFNFGNDLVKMFVGPFDPFTRAAERVVFAHD